MHCVEVLAPWRSVTVRLYTPLSAVVYPLIWSVVSCCSVLTRTFGLVPAHLRLLPEHVASVTLSILNPVSGSCSQVIVEMSSRWPRLIWAFRSRLDPGTTYTGSSLRMCTDIQWSPHGTENKDRTVLYYIVFCASFTYVTHTVHISTALAMKTCSIQSDFCLWSVCIVRTK